VNWWCGTIGPGVMSTRNNKKGSATRLVVVPNLKDAKPFKRSATFKEETVTYDVKHLDSNGQLTSANKDATDHSVTLTEKFTDGDKGNHDVKICTPCESSAPNKIIDTMGVNSGKNDSVVKRFTVDGNAARVYDPATKKAYDFVRVDASFKNGFVFTYGNDPKQ